MKTFYTPNLDPGSLAELGARLVSRSSVLTDEIQELLLEEDSWMAYRCLLGVFIYH